jgi:peroxiredoxin
MTWLSSFALACVLTGAGPDNSGSGQTGVAPAPSAVAQYEQLALEFEIARRALVETRGTALQNGSLIDLRRSFLERMRPLREGGVGQAIGWSLTHFEPDATDPRPVADVKRDWYARILPANAGAPWIWDDGIELVATLRNDRSTIGRELCASYAHAIFATMSNGDVERRLRALTLEADATGSIGDVEFVRRQAGAEVWRRELEAEPTGPLAEACQRALWRLRNLQIGELVPDVRGLDVNENEIALEDFRGKVVVLAFFSFERTGDRVRAAQLRKLHAQFERAPFTVLGVDQDPNPNVFRKLSEEFDLRFPCAFEGGRHGRIASMLHLDVPPRCLVIDRAGRLRHVDLETGALEAAVAELVAEPVSLGANQSQRAESH